MDVQVCPELGLGQAYTTYIIDIMVYTAPNNLREEILGTYTWMKIATLKL